MSNGTENFDFGHALTAYEAVAHDYEAIADDPHFTRWVSYYEALIVRYGSGQKRLLDVGCGTGRSTIAFRDLGYVATGFELSPSMIDVARAKAASKGIEFIVGDLRKMPDIGSFDVVTCIGEPLSYLTDDSQLLHAFQGVSEQLGDGGVFIFDMNTLGSYRRAYAKTHVLDKGDQYEVWQGGPAPVQPDGIVSVTHDYFAREGATWRRVSSKHVYRHHSDVTVRRLLGDAGLRLLGAHGITDGELTEAGDEDRGRKIVYVVGR